MLQQQLGEYFRRSDSPEERSGGPFNGKDWYKAIEFGSSLLLLERGDWNGPDSRHAKAQDSLEFDQQIDEKLVV